MGRNARLSNVWRYRRPRPQARKLSPELAAVVKAIEAGRYDVVVYLRASVKHSTFRAQLSHFSEKHGLIRPKLRRIDDRTYYVQVRHEAQ